MKARHTTFNIVESPPASGPSNLRSGRLAADSDIDYLGTRRVCVGACLSVWYRSMNPELENLANLLIVSYN